MGLRRTSVFHILISVSQDTQQEIGGLVNAGAGICQDLKLAVTLKAWNKEGPKALSLAGVWEDTYPNRPNNKVLISARARQKLTTMTPFQTPHLIGVHL